MNQLNKNAQEIYNYICRMDQSYPSSRTKAVAFVSDTREGVIAFYGEDIVELSITDCLNGENIFWLHMAADQKEAFRDSLQAFLSVLEDGAQKSDPIVRLNEPDLKKFVVVCTTGMSSQLFASMLQEEADALGMQANFDAMALNDLMQLENPDYNWILTTPQINFQYPRIREKFGERVMKISPKDFGTMDVNDVLRKLSTAKRES